MPFSPQSLPLAEERGANHDPFQGLKMLAAKVLADKKTAVREHLEAGGWPPHLIEFAAEWMLPNQVDERELASIETRLEAIAANVPPELLEPVEPQTPLNLSASQGAKIFVGATRASFLEALNKHLRPDEWRAIFRDNDELVRWDQFARSIKMPFRKGQGETMVENAIRAEIPLSAPTGEESALMELKDVLQSTGLEEVALPFVRSIHGFKYRGEGRGFGIINLSTGKIGLSIADSSRKMIVPILLHEIGHAMQSELYISEGTDGFLDEYGVLTQIQPTAFSPYAHSYEVTNGRESRLFVEESFAEDFKLYWMKPEALSAEKLGVFSQLHERFLPHIRGEKVRHQIRTVLGNYYSTNVEDILKIVAARQLEEILKTREEALRTEEV